MTLKSESSSRNFSIFSLIGAYLATRKASFLRKYILSKCLIFEIIGIKVKGKFH